MAYYDVFLMTTDYEFLGRSAASYATETLDDPKSEDPNTWAQQHGWELASQPGFGDAYASARAAGNEHPGSDPAVVTDAQILSAVQAIMESEG